MLWSVARASCSALVLVFRVWQNFLWTLVVIGILCLICCTPRTIEVIAGVLVRVQVLLGLGCLADSVAAFDRKVVRSLRRGKIRLVRVSWLVEQEFLVRCQELPDEAFLSRAEAATHYASNERRIAVLSYGWLMRGAPDPNGEHLALLKRNLRNQDYAGLFWDFASLPQAPRSKKDQRVFKDGLRLISSLYASPHGCAVIQLPVIPPCPAALTNSVIVCNASESDDAVRDALSTFGHVEVERRDSGEVIVQFGCSREAQGALAADASSLFGPGVYLIPAYNDRPYQDRGWCVFEEAAAMMVADADIPHKGLLRAPKLSRCTERGDLEEVVRTSCTPTDLEIRMRTATFTGKGDREVVVSSFTKYYQHIHSRKGLQARIDRARERLRDKGVRLVSMFVVVIGCLVCWLLPRSTLRLVSAAFQGTASFCFGASVVLAPLYLAVVLFRWFRSSRCSMAC